MNPLVSAIIPNYNYSRFVGEAIDSALSQTYQNLEVIVVDDGSTDESVAIIKSFGERVKMLSQANSGVSEARNNGARNSNGELLTFLDADDVWDVKKIESQVALYRSNPLVGLIHCGVRDIDEAGAPLAEHTEGMAGTVAIDLLLLERPVVLGGGSGIMVPRKIFEEVSGFDTRLSTSADWDLFFQVSSRYPVGFIPKILLNYRIHGSNMHGNIARMEREMLIAFGKAFDTRIPKLLDVERRAYGNLFRILAGSHFRAGSYGSFVRNALKSIHSRPSGIGYFASFPFRRVMKKFAM